MADAYVIGLQPTSVAPTLGSSFSLDLVVSGLPPEIVSAYDIDFNYDPTIISYVSSAPSGALGAPFDSLFGATSSTGSVNLFEVSLLSDSDLALNQGSSPLTLATLTFRGIGLGSASIDLAINALGGAQDPNTDLTADLLSLAHTVNGATVRVTPSTAVSEPGSFALLALGLFGMSWYRKRRTF